MQVYKDKVISLVDNNFLQYRYYEGVVVAWCCL